MGSCRRPGRGVSVFGNKLHPQLTSLSRLLSRGSLFEKLEVVIVELGNFTVLPKRIPMLVEYCIIFGNGGSHSYGLPVLASSVPSQVVATSDDMGVSQDAFFVHRRMAVRTASRFQPIGYSDLNCFEDLAAVAMFIMDQELLYLTDRVFLAVLALAHHLVIVNGFLRVHVVEDDFQIMCWSICKD